MYQAVLFDMDGVKLDFDNNALDAIAAQAIDRNTGARGLRSIMENMMTKIMYEIPSRDDVDTVVITKECLDGSDPKLLLKEMA